MDKQDNITSGSSSEKSLSEFTAKCDAKMIKVKILFEFDHNNKTQKCFFLENIMQIGVTVNSNVFTCNLRKDLIQVI